MGVSPPVEDVPEMTASHAVWYRWGPTCGRCPAVGYVLPSFNVHSVRGGFRIAQIGRTSHYLTASLENFTDALYAEFSNATFFRPQPRRTFLIGWTSTF